MTISEARRLRKARAVLARAVKSLRALDAGAIESTIVFDLGVTIRALEAEAASMEKALQ